MESSCVKPQPVQSSTESVALIIIEQSSVLKVDFPFLERVYIAPLLRDATDVVYLFE